MMMPIGLERDRIGIIGIIIIILIIIIIIITFDINTNRAEEDASRRCFRPRSTFRSPTQEWSTACREQRLARLQPSSSARSTS